MSENGIETLLNNSQQKLAKEKLALEVLHLQHTHKSLIREGKTRLTAVIIKALGNISTVFLLIISITGPINKYFHERNNDLRTPKLTEEIKHILDTKQDVVKRSLLLQISLEPPRIVAPILLKNFNDGALGDSLMTDVFMNMYFFSQSSIYYNTFLDKLASLTEPTDQDILENELARSSIVSFRNYIHQKDSIQTNITLTYLTLIEKLKLNDKEPFQKALDILDSDCKSLGYDLICHLIKKLKHENK